jgi:DnaA-homolog protein
MSAQLTLDIRLQDSASFENFLATGNEEIIQMLQDLVSSNQDSDESHLMHIWGASGCGKTHVLQATCHLAQAHHLRFAYFSVKDHSSLTPAVLNGLEDLDMVCLDDVDIIAGHTEWETALFTLCERMKACRGLLIITTVAAPSAMAFRLPDLLSRLRAGPVYQMTSLDDEGKHAALRLRAANRGIEITDDVSEYLLRRYPRDMKILFALLERIDQTSLQKKRRVTIPLIREMEVELQT